MTSAGPVKWLREELACSVCLDYLQDPVTITECGHNFCRGCLTQYWRESKASCPQCRKTAQPKNLRPNWQLANVVEIAKELSHQEEKAPDPKRVKGEGRLCEKHQEPFKLFCQEDQIFICVVCDRSKEHRSHEVVPLEEASQEYKDKLHASLKIVREDTEDQMKESEALFDVRSTLKRYEEKQKFGDLVAFDPDLKQKICDVCGINDFLEDHMKQFKDTLASGLQVQKVNVTLDPDTAHPHLVLSEDRKSVKEGEQKQELPNNPERFYPCRFVMGCEEFTAGQHFWEVIVEDEGEVGWAVGVARKSMRRKGPIPLGPEGGIWAVGRAWGEYSAWEELEFLPLSLTEEPKRILVSLDYEGGRVTFLDADRGTVLHEFSGASFSGETLQPFFCVEVKAHLRLAP